VATLTEARTWGDRNALTPGARDWDRVHRPPARLLTLAGHDFAEFVEATTTEAIFVRLRSTNHWSATQIPGGTALDDRYVTVQTGAKRRSVRPTERH
jgi:hypothetical protein